MTDGGIWIDDLAREAKRFDVHDGLGIALWRAAGGRFGVVTGRRGLALAHRLKELGVDALAQGSSEKASDVRALCERWSIAPSDCVFVGDDLPDIPAMHACAFGIAVASARAEVVACASAVTLANPGAGAIREVIEAALRAQGKWGQVVERFGASQGAMS
jgi:3-deoxy-D-manno-octulosonate 8-phosphate phosphatase (KDO 8-P phosphatase)